MVAPLGVALRAERIGHGISCLDDPGLVARLRESQIPLEVCPTSNVCTWQVPDLAVHPLPRLLERGLFVTLNSDDPPMFGTTLTQEYRRAAAVLGLGRAQLATLAADGVRASFLDSAAKRALIEEIDAVVSAASGADIGQPVREGSAENAPLTASPRARLAIWQRRLPSGAGSWLRRPVVLLRLYVIDPFSGRLRVRMVRPQPPLQVGQHVPELVLRPGVIAARGHLPGDAEPQGQRDRVIRAEPPL